MLNCLLNWLIQSKIWKFGYNFYWFFFDFIHFFCHFQFLRIQWMVRAKNGREWTMKWRKEQVSFYILLQFFILLFRRNFYVVVNTLIYYRNSRSLSELQDLSRLRQEGEGQRTQICSRPDCQERLQWQRKQKVPSTFCNWGRSQTIHWCVSSNIYYQINLILFRAHFW